MDYIFKTDGCSGCLMFFIRRYWRLRHGCNPPWEPDCVRHDTAYWVGGNAIDRVAADTKLVEAVARHGYPFLARIMFIGISVGGTPRLPLPWRWAYGWRWSRLKGYDDATTP